ncbi:hypothetical protein L596_022911 [Steinernema carpocapsae]|uniref:ShKT domain-containing protein n=1 Tax=Steinernema carpocapsae TaxID=34508 RepID=A0A4U5MBY5_STECR|nr:hypothetical protein L596_022911 [Steinernema carpocapsae]
MEILLLDDARIRMESGSAAKLDRSAKKWTEGRLAVGPPPPGCKDKIDRKRCLRYVDGGLCVTRVAKELCPVSCNACNSTVMSTTVKPETTAEAKVSTDHDFVTTTTQAIPESSESPVGSTLKPEEPSTEGNEYTTEKEPETNTWWPWWTTSNWWGTTYSGNPESTPEPWATTWWPWWGTGTPDYSVGTTPSEPEGSTWWPWWWGTTDNGTPGYPGSTPSYPEGSTWWPGWWGTTDNGTPGYPGSTPFYSEASTWWPWWGTTRYWRGTTNNETPGYPGTTPSYPDGSTWWPWWETTRYWWRTTPDYHHSTRPTPKNAPSGLGGVLLIVITGERLLVIRGLEAPGVLPEPTITKGPPVIRTPKEPAIQRIHITMEPLIWTPSRPHHTGTPGYETTRRHHWESTSRYPLTGTPEYETTRRPPWYTSTVTPQCADTPGTNCQRFKNEGLCIIDAIRDECKLSCGACDCKDLFTSLCANWKAENLCFLEPIKNVCPYSCDACIRQPQ